MCIARDSVQLSVTDWLALARFFAMERGPGPTGLGAAHLSADAKPATTKAQPPGGSPGGTSQWPAPPKSFRDEWLALRAKHPEVFTVSADEIDAWHRHEAWRCESRKDWSNAVHHLSELLKTHPDSGDLLPRRAAAYIAWAEGLLSLAPGFSRVSTNATTSPAASAAFRPQALETALPPAAANTGLKPGANEKAASASTAADRNRLTSAATNLLERALTDYNRTLAWVDRYPAIAKESRLPFVEKRREVYLKLGRKAEAEADERELKAPSSPGKN